MASPVDLVSDDHLKCSLCLEVFTQPVSTPCGHSFCLVCVTTYWEGNEVCQCPLCNKRFCMRPEIATNTILEELAVQVKRRRVDMEEHAAKAWEVACDVCPGMKLKALKSCLVCFTSYCETHLEPHLRVSVLKRHRLVDPVENIEDRMCKKHERLLELFCRSDQTCVCALCSETDHKSHDIVPVEEECGKKKNELETIRSWVQQMIQKRLKYVQEIRQCVEEGKVSTLKEIENSAEAFIELRDCIERCQEKVIGVMEEKQRKAERTAEGLAEELEQEISELERRNTEMEQLSHTEDHIHFLQSFPTLSSIPQSRDWSSVVIHSDLCVGMLRRAMSKVVQSIQKKVKMLTESELNHMRRHKANVTMDANTANAWLYLSDFGKRIKKGKVRQAVPDNPERFNSCSMVLGNPAFTSGRHYWEVKVGVRHDWHVGVAMETVKRKGEITVNPQHGFYGLAMDGFEYYALSFPRTMLYVTPKPRTIGVYLDYEQGQVSFYNVDTMFHIYTFAGHTFTGKVHPYFYLYTKAKKSEPLSISFVIDPKEQRFAILRYLSSFPANSCNEPKEQAGVEPGSSLPAQHTSQED